MKDVCSNPNIVLMMVGTKGYCADLFFDQAIRWIGDQKDKNPFFVWFWLFPVKQTSIVPATKGGISALR